MNNSELEAVRDTFITALEGGSYYWLYLQYDKEKYNNLKAGYSFRNGHTEHVSHAELLWDAIWNCDFVVKVYDINDSSEFLGNISKQEIIDGLERMKEQQTSHYGDLFNNMDAETADVFLQMVVMAEIVYG